MAEKKYIVLHGAVGPHSQGAILTEKQAGDSLEWWKKVGAVRVATAAEAKAGDPGELGSEARSVELSKGAMDYDAIEDKAAEDGEASAPPATATDADKQNADKANGEGE